MAETSIEWTDRTWNPVRGCSRVSEGCRNCYAERMAGRFADGPFAGFVERIGGEARWTGKVALVPEKLGEPLSWRKPCRVFVNSMSDLFHEGLSDEAIAAVFGVMAAAPQHTFQVLTKRPERMRAFLTGDALSAEYCMAVAAEALAERGWLPKRCGEDNADHDERVWTKLTRDGRPDLTLPLPNVWLGVSIEDQATADERIPLLLDTPAAVRFVSAEPLLGAVDLRLYPMAHGRGPTPSKVTGLDWVIVGGESGKDARPCDVAWIRSVVEQCKAAGTACFVKQLGARPEMEQGCGDCDPCIVNPRRPERCAVGSIRIQHFLRDPKGGNPEEWPSDLRVREFPYGNGRAPISPEHAARDAYRYADAMLAAREAGR